MTAREYFAFNIILYYIHIYGWIKKKLGMNYELRITSKHQILVNLRSTGKNISNNGKSVSDTYTIFLVT